MNKDGYMTLQREEPTVGRNSEQDRWYDERAGVNEAAAAAEDEDAAGIDKDEAAGVDEVEAADVDEDKKAALSKTRAWE
ncbi:hypothetical protein A0H81_06545 [Grifola frondosa]|uniref:Uncharacterized protein n=1 Tax=Grifola frondosa TaxID=5627 RepID=A0A1C7MEW5_GRIFR|nr:hypothetical protein A0H81_06545 [Grifola frondosa]